MSENELLQIVVDKLGGVGEEVAELREDFRLFFDVVGRCLGAMRFDLQTASEDLAALRAAQQRAQNPGDGLTDFRE